MRSLMRTHHSPKPSLWYPTFPQSYFAMELWQTEADAQRSCCSWLCSPEGASPRRPFPSCSRPGGRRDSAFCTSSLDGSPSRLDTCREGGRGKTEKALSGECLRSRVRIREPKLGLLCSDVTVIFAMFLTLLMRLSLMWRNCCCASCMCRRFWSTRPFPSMALCRASREMCPKNTSSAANKSARAGGGKWTCCAFPRVRRAVVRGGLRNGRLVWRPYFPETQTNNRSVDQRRANTHVWSTDEEMFLQEGFSLILMQEILKDI